MLDHGIYEKVDIHGPVPGFIIQHTRPGSEIVKSHWHQELEINTAFEGSSRFFINGRVEDVTPPLFPPPLSHRGKALRLMKEKLKELQEV